jgi:ABC-type sugar transport system substrate-binding protein
MPNRFMTAAATLVVLSAPRAQPDNLSIGIVTFSTSDIHTNQMVDTMTAEAKSKGWTVENLNANGDPLKRSRKSNSL